MREIIIKSKKNVFGSFLGRHTSKFKGSGADFKELREYQYNEDAKRIDWKISAKLNKPYIKEFEESRELNIIICILVSGSLHFGTKILKSELIGETVGTLGYLAAKNEDKIRVVFADNPPVFLKPTKSQKLIPHFITKTLTYPYLKKTPPQNLDFLNRLKKGILILIGDFFTIPKFNFKHETYVIITRDRLEENPPRLNNINLIDPINFKISNTLTPEKIKSFIANNDKKLYSILAQKHIPFTKIYTNEDIKPKLARLFL
ncbi:MAG: DUF58 domain-containing protein [Epsilonproteobacteria bacterium]|nr:DUF58 domain-containing protein [Campylobacterota bacterium]